MSKQDNILTMEEVEDISDLQQDKLGIWHTQNQLSDVSYPDEGNQNCFKGEDSSFWFKNRNQIIAKVITKYPFDGGFADVGGGNGYQTNALSKKFTNKDFYLIEPGVQGCRNARSRGVANVYNMLSEDFPFSNFDIGAVGIFDVIEHIENDKKWLEDLSSALDPETTYFITVPAFQTLWSDVDTMSGHFRRYTKKSMQELAGGAGLELLYSSYFFSYLTLPMFFLRCLPHKFGRKRDTAAIVEAESVNHSKSKFGPLFSALGTTETVLMNLVPIPIGTSLIAVLRKSTQQ